MSANYLKEIYLDSDTKIACISGAPSEVPEDWFLTNDMKAQARADVEGMRAAAAGQARSARRRTIARRPLPGVNMTLDSKEAEA